MNKKSVVLNRNAQFQNVYRNGRSFVSPLVVTYVARRRRGGVRYGITASKKIGGAVERNRARRVIKAAVAGLLREVGKDCDIVFVARGITGSAKSDAVSKAIYTQLKKAGVVSDGAAFLLRGGSEEERCG